MSEYLEIAQQNLLTPVGMEISDLQKTLGQIMTHSIDQADLYFESSRSESWVMEEGIIKEGSHSIAQGVGVRAISGEKTGFAYSARSIASSGNDGSLQAWQSKQTPALYINKDPIDSIPADQKVALLKKLDVLARKKDSRVQQVVASLGGEHTTVLIAGIDGTFTADVRPLVRLNVSVIVEENGKRERGTAGGGGRFCY
jgi:TldD protein